MDQNAFNAGTLMAPAPPDYEGYIDQRSTRHIAGWARDINNPDLRLNLEIILTGPDKALPETILATTKADRFDDQTMAALASRDANYGFYILFDQSLTEAERDNIRVRIAATGQYLPMAHAPVSAYEPINLIALDIVNNCNLRCPFCLFDYSATNKTEFMTADVFKKLFPLFPYVRDGNIWLSCLHEPTLHPQLVDFIGLVPREYRKKIMFSTNLAKRMPESYFTFLASSGINHINISVESLIPGIYETFRAGARHHIFVENLEKLWRAFSVTPNPPALRYIILAYRSNLAEMKSMMEYFQGKPATWEIEIRTTMNKPHIPQSFRDAEFLTSAEWKTLDSALQTFNQSKVVKVFPPKLQGYDEHPTVEPGKRPFRDDISPVPRPLNLRVTYDGEVTAFSVGLDVSYFRSNLIDMADPLATLLSL